METQPKDKYAEESSETDVLVEFLYDELKKRDLNQGTFFKMVYRMLIGKEKRSQIGWFSVGIG